jgi:RNA polymerase sigma-70 factor (ECF subfamily)
VKRLQEGDKTATREFYSLYADTMAGICSRYIADEEDLKDVFQDALVHIFTHIDGFRYRGTGSLEAWVKKVVVNESLKFLKRKEQHEVLPMDVESLEEVGEEFPSISEIPPDTLRQMINRLPTGYRTVLNLYVFEDKSHQEIARLLGIRKDSSAPQLHRARKLLAKMIRKYNDDNSHADE